MGEKFSRRELAAGLAAAVPALAQTPAASPAPQDPLGKAREALEKNGDRLGSIEVPITTEPSFVFKP